MSSLIYIKNYYNHKIGVKRNNLKIDKLKITSNVVIIFVILLISLACSKEKHTWEGVWQTNIEFYPGFTVASEFELHQDSIDKTWSAKWEIPELMSFGVYKDVKVTPTYIEVDLESGWTLKGILFAIRLNTSRLASLKITIL